MRAVFGLIALLVIGVVFVSGCTTQIGPGITFGDLPFCTWVYKTSGDHFDLVHAAAYDEERGYFAHVRGANKTQLANGYIGEHRTMWCYQNVSIDTIFLDKTVERWQQEIEAHDTACREEIKSKGEQLRIEKCGSLDFDFFVECNTFQSATGEETCSIGPVPEFETENPTNCTYYITLEENIKRNSCKTPDAPYPYYSLDLVLDEDPFSEFYLCDADFSIEEINSIIADSQLDAECEKLI